MIIKYDLLKLLSCFGFFFFFLHCHARFRSRLHDHAVYLEGRGPLNSRSVELWLPVGYSSWLMDFSTQEIVVKAFQGLVL